MPALHIRNLDDAVIAGLKARAARNHRSLQGEVQSLLEAAVRTDRSHRGDANLRLRLHTVGVGRTVSYSRDVIYDDRGR